MAQQMLFTTAEKKNWTNQELFVVWPKHFVRCTKPFSTDTVLLIAEIYYSHLSSEAYENCRNNFILMLSIPPQSSHRMQPLNVACYKSLKAAFLKQCDLFTKSYALQKITRTTQTSTKLTQLISSVSGFKSTGIMPMTPNIIWEGAFKFR